MFGFVERWVRVHFSTTHRVDFPQFRSLGGTYRSPQTPRVQRAVTLLRRLHRQPFPNYLLLRIGKLHFIMDPPPGAKMSFQAKSYWLSLICAVVQVFCLATYVAAYFPGGITTLRFGSSMILRGASSILPR